MARQVEGQLEMGNFLGSNQDKVMGVIILTLK